MNAHTAGAKARTASDHRNTDAYLVAELAAVRAEPRGFSSERGKELLAFATAKFSWILAKVHSGNTSGEKGPRYFQIEDVAQVVWETWTSAGFAQAEKPWAYTNDALTKSLFKRKKLESQFLTEASAHNLERAARLAGEQMELANFASAGIEAAEHEEDFVTAEVERRSAARVDRFTSPPLNNAVILMTHVGLDFETAGALVEAIIERACTAESAVGAYDTVSRDLAIPAALGVSVEMFRRLTSLLLGSAAGGRGTIAAYREGVNPRSEKNILNSTMGLLELAAPNEWREAQLKAGRRHKKVLAESRKSA